MEGHFLGSIFSTASGFGRRRPSFARFSTLANMAIIAAGVSLLSMQLHGYLHHTQVEEVRFLQKEHNRIHEDMDIENLAKESTRENL